MGEWLGGNWKKGRVTKGHDEALGGEAHVSHLDCAGGFRVCFTTSQALQALLRGSPKSYKASTLLWSCLKESIREKWTAWVQSGISPTPYLISPHVLKASFPFFFPELKDLLWTLTESILNTATKWSVGLLFWPLKRRKKQCKPIMITNSESLVFESTINVIAIRRLEQELRQKERNIEWAHVWQTFFECQPYVRHF